MSIVWLDPIFPAAIRFTGTIDQLSLYEKWLGILRLRKKHCFILFDTITLYCYFSHSERDLGSGQEVISLEGHNTDMKF